MQGRVTVVQRGSWSLSEGPVETHPLCDVCRCHSSAGDNSVVRGQGNWFEPAIALSELASSIGILADSPCALAATIARPKGHASPRNSSLPEIAVARFAVPEPEDLDGRQTNWCHGSAGSPDDAKTLAIVEALERYAGLLPAPPGVTASYATVADRAILPTELPLFSVAQYRKPGFPFCPFDAERAINWTFGYNLTRKRPILVPTTAAWYGRDDKLLGETSSGVAAHSSRGDALLHGALELIERDAFMIHWLHRLSPPLFDAEQIEDASVQAQIVAIQATGYTVRVADLTTDLAIPAYLAIGFRTDRHAPALMVGAGCSLDAGVALGRAFKELYAATLNPTPHWRLGPPLALADVAGLEDHARAYEHPDWLERASFLWASQRRAKIGGAEEQRGDRTGDNAAALGELIARLAQHGHDLIGADITPPEIGRCRLRVVRAIIPGLQPLGFADRVRLGGRRLYEAPVRMGYRTAPTVEADLNRDPHCFP